MSNQLDRNRQKWERTRDDRSEAGKRSGEIRRRKKEQNEQMFDLKTRREHSEQVPMVLKKDEEAEHLSDLSNTYEPNVDVDDNDNENGNEKENVDGDGDTARTSTSTSTTNIKAVDISCFLLTYLCLNSYLLPLTISARLSLALFLYVTFWFRTMSVTRLWEPSVRRKS